MQARVESRPAPAGLLESALEYRHRAFNWLVHYGDANWDGVTTPTQAIGHALLQAAVGRKRKSGEVGFSVRVLYRRFP